MYQSASSTLILPFLKPSITTANSFSPFISINPKEKFYPTHQQEFLLSSAKRKTFSLIVIQLQVRARKRRQTVTNRRYKYRG